MTDEETLMALGLIAIEARQARGLHRQAAAEKMGLNYQTIGTFEAASRPTLPKLSSRTAMENFYGWRMGSILEIWERRREIPFGSLSEADLMAPPTQEKTGLLEAKHLTDEQLINELSFRLLMRDNRHPHD